MQVKMLVLNFKSYLGIKESAKVAGFVSDASDKGAFSGNAIVIAPPTIAMTEVKSSVNLQKISLCSQDVDIEGKGAYTGSTSMESIIEARCKYSLIGHSELRNRKHPSMMETDELIKVKMEICLDHGITPILCLGEKIEERKKGKTNEVLSKQLSLPTASLVVREKVNEVYIAYEPVWAISSTMTQKPRLSDMLDAIRFIKEELSSKTKIKKDNVKILYGGSVNSENIREYLEDSDIDGVLIGSASARIEELAKIANVLKK